MYVCGGFGDGLLSSCERYSFHENAWELLSTNMPVGLSGAAAVSIGRQLYVLGGYNYDNGGALVVARRYDATAGRWTELPGMREKRGFAAAAVLNETCVVVAGGNSHRYQTLSSCEVYDVLSDAWRPFPSLRETRAGHSLVAWGDGVLFAIGGRYREADGSYKCRDTIERWDEESGVWSILPVKLPHGLSQFAALLL